MNLGGQISPVWPVAAVFVSFSIGLGTPFEPDRNTLYHFGGSFSMDLGGQVGSQS